MYRVACLPKDDVRDDFKADFKDDVRADFKADFKADVRADFKDCGLATSFYVTICE